MKRRMAKAHVRPVSSPAGAGVRPVSLTALLDGAGHVWVDESDPATTCARCGIAWRVVRRDVGRGWLEPCRELAS